MQHPPPTGGGTAHVVRVYSVPQQGTDLVRFLDAYRGMMTHYVKERNKARPVHCPGRDSCETSRHRLAATWKGYAPGEQYDPPRGLWLPCVIEITESLEELLAGRTLRGEVWCLTRERKPNERSNVTGAFVERQGSATLRTVFDMVPVLCRMYHVSELTLDVPNPIPRRTLLEPTRGGVPASVAAAFATPAPVDKVEDFAKRAELLEAMRKSWGIGPKNGKAVG